MAETENDPATLDNQRQDVYPVLKTNRILLSQPSSGAPSLKIRIDYSLNLKRPHYSGTDEIVSFMNSPEGRRDTKVTFLVVDQRSESLVADLTNPSTVRNTLMNATSDERFIRIVRTNGYQRVPLREALLQNADQRNYTTATETRHGTHYETYSTLEFEYNLSDTLQANTDLFDNDGSPAALSRLHLLGFIETPFMTANQTPPPGVAEELITIPLTELTYDLLLNQSSDYVTGRTLLRPPVQREIFYVQDEDPNYSRINLRPYSGPAHYHGPSLPAPSGYVGWMAGHMSDAMGPKLSVRSVPNHKVLVDAPPWNSQPMLPAIGQPGITGETGGHLEDFVKSILTEKQINNPAQRTAAMLQASISAATRSSRASFVEPWSRRHTWITMDQNEDDDNLDSSYNSIIGVKFLEILEHHSPFGALISHFKRIVTEERDQQRPDLILAKTMLERFMQNSRILEMSIIRRRLDQRPYNNNDQDTKTYNDFEENQKNKIIVQTYDMPGQPADAIFKTVFPTRWHASEIEEVRMDFQPPAATRRGRQAVLSARALTSNSYVELADLYSTRSFLIRDYELFYNLDYGKYTYDIEMIILDGSKSLIDSFTQNLRDSSRRLEGLIVSLSSPVIRDEVGRPTTGYYDYHSRKFHEVPEELRNNTRQAVFDLITHSRHSMALMTGIDPFSSDDIVNIVAAADPGLPTTTLDGLNYLITESERTLSSLEKILQDTFLESAEAASNNTEEVYVPNATGNAAPIVHVRCNTGVVHDASDTLKMCADYGIISNRLGDDSLGRFIQSARLQSASETLREVLENSDLDRPSLPGQGYSGTAPSLQRVENMLPDLIAADDNFFMPIEFTVPEGIRIEVIPSAPMQFTRENPRLASDSSSSANAYATTSQSRISMNNLGQSARRKALSFGSSVPAGLNKRSIIKIRKIDFDSMTPDLRSVKEAKILTMMQEDSHVIGAALKSSAFDARFLSSTVGGMSSTFSGFDISSSSRDITEAALKSVAIDSSLLSTGLKSAIMDTALDAETEDDFLRKVDENYKELLAIKNNLKGLYTAFNRLVSLTKISLPAGFDRERSKNLFENGPDTNFKKSDLEIAQSPFKRKGAKFVEFSETGDAKMYDSVTALKRISALQGAPTMNGEIKMVKLFKLEQVGARDNIPGVNNALMMELN